MTPDQIAMEAKQAVAAGANALHIHPKTDRGVDALAPEIVAAAVNAVRKAVPGVPVGITTGAWAVPDSQERVEIIRSWTVLPDFASVNWHESGAEQVAEALWQHGIGVEAGLWEPDVVASWRRWKDRGRCLRVLLEVVKEYPPNQAVTEANRLVTALGPDITAAAVLLHGEGSSSWPVFEEAVRQGFDVRIGLEDVLVLPDGTPATGNAQLVTAARELMKNNP